MRRIQWLFPVVIGLVACGTKDDTSKDKGESTVRAFAITAECGSCAAEAAQNQCAPQISFCGQDPTCGSVGDCVQGCAQGDVACLQGCAQAAIPQFSFQDLASCVVCDACAAECDGAWDCGGGSGTGGGSVGTGGGGVGGDDAGTGGSDPGSGGADPGTGGGGIGTGGSDPGTGGGGIGTGGGDPGACEACIVEAQEECANAGGQNGDDVVACVNACAPQDFDCIQACVDGGNGGGPLECACDACASVCGDTSAYCP